MAQNQFSRTQMLLGRSGLNILEGSRVAVFGCGGVGSYAAEGLARSGVGAIDLFDDDNICLTNVNRQVMANIRNVGQDKIEAMRERILLINPRCEVGLHKVFYGKDTYQDIDLSGYDYIIDAIDTISAKMLLVEQAAVVRVPIISSMGTGNKLDPTQFKVTDLSKTRGCPMARTMRKELKRRGITKLKVVFSQEKPMVPDDNDGELNCKFNCICPADATAHCTVRRQVPGSVSFVPSVAGMILASEAIKDICGIVNGNTTVAAHVVEFSIADWC